MKIPFWQRIHGISHRGPQAVNDWFKPPASYLRAIRIVFVLVSIYLMYTHFRQFFPYLAQRDYILLIVFISAVPCFVVYMESRVKELFTQELILGLV